MSSSTLPKDAAVGNDNRSNIMINETNQLSEREREILRLVASGLSNQQIANQLGISVNTVKVHLRNVFSKIGVASRTEATMYAVRAGIVTIDRAEPALLSVPPAEPLTVETVTPEPVAAPEPEIALELIPPLEQTPQPALEQVAATQVLPLAEPRQEIIVAQPAPSARSGWLIPALVGVALLAVILAVAWSFGWFGSAPAPEESADLARWKELPAAQLARAGFAIASSGDKLYAIGGQGADGVLDRVERYDASLGIWTELSRKPTAVVDVRAVVLGGKLYVPGGRRSNDPSAITTVFERNA
jgi:DNA-binding CsgD family transcriptional regulator